MAERIRLTRRLQILGLTLRDVIDALHATDRGEVSCESERWRLEAVLDRIDARIAELRSARRDVVDVLARCDRDECVFGEADIGA